MFLGVIQSDTFGLLTRHCSTHLQIDDLVSRFRAVDKITCAVCNTEASVSQIFDFYIPDPLKRYVY